MIWKKGWVVRFTAKEKEIGLSEKKSITTNGKNPTGDRIAGCTLILLRLVPSVPHAVV